MSNFELPWLFLVLAFVLVFFVTIIAFLKRRGYNVLNLIELRRAAPEENPHRTIAVGSEEFRC